MFNMRGKLTQVLTPSNEEIWQQQHVYSETHFNVGARGPGSYKVW